MEKRDYCLNLDDFGSDAGSVEGDQKKAKGYAAVFNSDSLDLGGFIERILPGAFTRSLADAANGKRNIFALWAHDDAQPVGSTKSGRLTLVEDERGLAFEMDTGRMTPAQLSALAEGDLRMSFGFCVRDQEWKELDDGSIERTLIDLDLVEVSFVISPAYPDTTAALRSLEDWKVERSAPVVEEVPVAKTDTSEMLKRVLAQEVKIRTHK